ncbi:ABC transporter substrate-binding protein [Dankookia sp. P2]|uniref:ABC transporter substrate-binding protein n=1 Tax=Dankookia sp. P2 TaxID=3423955 RepID=UPI003D66DA7A
MPVTRRDLAQGTAAALALPWMRRAAAAPGPLVVVVEAEYGYPSSTSAQAVELGVRIACDAINAARPPGAPMLEVRPSDNGAIAAIAVDNFLAAADDPAVIAVFGGKFSPVQIELVPHAAARGLLLLSPWGSADGIVAPGRDLGWSFRLSLRDSWAAPAFVAEARRQHGATRLGLLLPTTAWGRSNEQALTLAAAVGGAAIVGARWFHWGEKSLVARYQELRRAGAEAIILIANETEGAVLVRELAALPAAERLPVISHWGISGGQFPALAGPALAAVDLSVIQTFSFVGNARPEAASLLAEVQRRRNGVAAARVESPVGVAQGHDLMRLLGLALHRVGGGDRAALRDALEALPRFAGAVRDYDPAFTAARHEALGPEQILFARYTEAGALLPVA